MNEENDRTILKTEYLVNLLKRVFLDPELELKEWQMTRITGGLEAASKIYRLAGFATIRGQREPWSMIMKKIDPDKDVTDPNGFRYWRREIQIYQSEFLEQLTEIISLPEKYAILENPDGSVCILMEDVQDEFQHPWHINQFIDTAYQLGLFNGVFLAGQSLPEDQWGSRDWLRKYLINATPMVDFIKQNPDHPVVKALLPGLSLPMTLALWDEFPRLVNRLDELPQTFCHQDAFTQNLFYRKGKFIAIDWGYAGIAPVGAELAPLIGVAFTFSKFPSIRADELDQVCFESYLRGLRDAGFEPDRKQVRLGFILTMTLRYVLGGVVGETLPTVLDEQKRKNYSEAIGVSEDEASKTEAGVVKYYQRIMMEALQSMGLGFIIRFIARTILWAIRFAAQRIKFS